MNRAEITQFLSNLLETDRLSGPGKHWAKEVSIDPWGRQAKRVDYMQFSPADQCSISGIEKGNKKLPGNESGQRIDDEMFRTGQLSVYDT